jgi:hypothetical protein
MIIFSLLVNVVLIVEQLCMIVYFTHFEPQDKAPLFGVALSFMACEFVSSLIAMNNLKRDKVDNL